MSNRKTTTTNSPEYNEDSAIPFIIVMAVSVGLGIWLIVLYASGSVNACNSCCPVVNVTQMSQSLS